MASDAIHKIMTAVLEGWLKDQPPAEIPAENVTEPIDPTDTDRLDSLS